MGYTEKSREPTPSPPKPPIFFIPYLVQVLTYLPCSDSVHPCFLSCPTLSYFYAIAPPPELCTRSSSRTPIPVHAPPLDSELLLYLNPLYLSIQPNLIIALLMLHYVSRSLLAFKFPPTNSLSPDSCRTPVSGLLRNYGTYR